jgi:hypothetical protein
MSNPSKNYVNGLFIEEKEGPYGTYLSIGITEDGIKAIQALPKTAKGWRNLTATRQKDNQSKFSTKPYTPKSNAQVAEEGGKTYGGDFNPDDSSSDLPF